jgi:hypothetical protein
VNGEIPESGCTERLDIYFGDGARKQRQPLRVPNEGRASMPGTTASDVASRQDERHDLDDVVRIRDALCRGELSFRDVPNEAMSPNEADEENLRKSGSQLRTSGALPKFTLKRLHQMVTVRNLVRSTDEGTT